MVNDKDSDMLSSMNSICRYVNRSPATIIQWEKTLQFPAKKINDRWTSSKEMIDQWNKNQLGQSVKVSPKKEPSPGGKEGKKPHAGKGQGKKGTRPAAKKPGNQAAG